MHLEQTPSLNTVLSTRPAPAPPGVVAGTQQIRQAFVYDRTSSTVGITTFVVSTGSVTPYERQAVLSANSASGAETISDSSRIEKPQVARG